MQTNDRNILEIVLHYYELLMRRKWLIVGITGAITLGTIIFALVSIKLPPSKSPLPNIYTAEAILFVSPNEQSGISDSILQALGMNQPSSVQSGFSNGDMILEILRSRTILDRLSEEFDIPERFGIDTSEKSKTREILLSKFSFIYARNTGSLKLSYVDTDPVFARDIVNRTVILLSDWFVQNRGLARQKMKQNLEEKLAEVRADIDSLQNRLKDLQKRYGVLNAEELGASQAASLANLRSQLILKEIEIKNYSTYSKINDPRLEQLNEELQNLRDLIAKSQTVLPDISQAQGRPRTIADVAQEFSQLTNELDIQQRIYNTLSPQYEAAKLSPESDPIFEVFEMAEIPDTKTGPRRTSIVIKACGASLAFSILLVLAMNLVGEWKKDYLQKKQKQAQV